MREEPTVVLSGLGCGQFWRRSAIEAAARKGEPFPAYLELHLPTVAHHLGFRVRGMGGQDQHVTTDEPSAGLRREPIDAGAWVIHPVKGLWDDKGTASEDREATLRVLHLTHFDPPLHQLRLREDPRGAKPGESGKIGQAAVVS